MENRANNHEANKQQEPQEEFVVPHMQTCCLTNSLAYKEVLKNPKLFYNWDELPEEYKRVVFKHCGEEVQKLDEIDSQHANEPNSRMPIVDVVQALMKSNTLI